MTSTPQPTFQLGDILVATVRAVAGVVSAPVDVYVVLQAGSAFFSLQATPFTIVP